MIRLRWIAGSPRSNCKCHGSRNLRGWARLQGLDPALVAALNPGWHSGQGEVLAPLAGRRTAGPNGRGKAN